MRKNFLLINIFFVAVVLFFAQKVLSKTSSSQYSFIVAGHTYGAHAGKNQGLYPKFLEYIEKKFKKRFSFMVLNGDIVRHANKASWDQALNELKSLDKQYYFVMGNHDNSIHGRAIFAEQFGGTFYSFSKGTELFVVLDAQIERGVIPPSQLEFLSSELNKDPKIKNVFIFFHELIWTSKTPKYRKIQHNFGSYNRIFRSNFWEDVLPLLETHKNKQIYIIAGDVGGNPNTVPAFYEDLGHIKLIASGMGEIRDENFLLVRVKNSEVTFELIPLNKEHQILPLEDYSLKNIAELVSPPN